MSRIPVGDMPNSRAVLRPVPHWQPPFAGKMPALLSQRILAAAVVIPAEPALRATRKLHLLSDVPRWRCSTFASSCRPRGLYMFRCVMLNAVKHPSSLLKCVT